MTMTTRKRHSPEQVVRKLAQADRMLGEGKDVADVCRELQISEQTYYRWRNQFGGLKADDAKRLIGTRDGRTPPSSGCSPTRSWRRPR
jgi:transposase-like protein